LETSYWLRLAKRHVVAPYNRYQNALSVGVSHDTLEDCLFQLSQKRVLNFLILRIDHILPKDFQFAVRPHSRKTLENLCSQMVLYERNNAMENHLNVRHGTLAKI
jgi:hypothetical protein